MLKALIFLIVGLLIFSCSFMIYNNSKEEIKLMSEDNYLIKDKSMNYTPSQNLAIEDGRYEDATKSIKDMETNRW